MYCTKCGTKNKNDSNFCYACGAKLETYESIGNPASEPTTPGIEQTVAPKNPNNIVENIKKAFSNLKFSFDTKAMPGKINALGKNKPFVLGAFIAFVLQFIFSFLKALTCKVSFFGMSDSRSISLYEGGEHTFLLVLSIILFLVGLFGFAIPLLTTKSWNYVYYCPPMIVSLWAIISLLICRSDFYSQSIDSKDMKGFEDAVSIFPNFLGWMVILLNFAVIGLLGWIVYQQFAKPKK